MGSVDTFWLWSKSDKIPDSLHEYHTHLRYFIMTDRYNSDGMFSLWGMSWGQRNTWWFKCNIWAWSIVNILIYRVLPPLLNCSKKFVSWFILCIGGHSWFLSAACPGYKIMWCTLRVMVFCVGVPGTGAYDNVRPLAYQDAKVFLLCFRVSDPDSLDNAVSKVCDLCALQWGSCFVSCVAKSCVVCE